MSKPIRLTKTATPHLRRSVIACAIAHSVLIMAGATLYSATPTVAHAQETNATKSYAIKGDTLTAVLTQFGRQAGVLLSFSAAQTNTLHSAGLNGNHTTASALREILAGTGLQAQPQQNGGYIIAAAATSGANGEEAVLPAVNVVAGTEGLHSNVTEGTGSYTTAGPTRSATRLQLSVRETPQSMTVITNQRIKDQRMITAEDALINTTGISTYAGDTARTRFYTRGFELNSYVIDGVSYAGSNVWGDHLSTLAMYDRVEIIRGATGLTSTTGDPSGALNLLRKRATSRTLTGSVDLVYGRWNNINPTFDVSTPLNAEGSIRARIVGDMVNADSYMDRYQKDRKFVYGTVEADLTDRTTIVFGFDHTRRRDDGATFGAIPSLFSNGQTMNLPRSFSSAPNWAYYYTDATTAFGRLEHAFDNGWHAETELQSRRRKRDSEQLYFLTGAGVNQQTGLGLNPLLDKEEAGLKEITWSASAGGPFAFLGRQHQLNVGVSTSKQSTHRKYYTGTGAPIGSVYDWNGNYPYPAAWNLGTNYDWREISKTISGFASGRFSITDGLHVILGGRYNDWKGDVRHFQEFTPYAGVTFDVNKNHTVYASYAEQFNPQDFMDVTGNYLDPKVGKSYEAGIKGEYFDGALNGALSVYKTMQDNVAEIITPNVLIPGTSQRAYRSVSGISTTGVELDVSGQLAPGWQLGLGIGLSQTKDRLGKDFLGYLPDNTVKLYTSYRLPDAWNKFTIGGGMRWQDGTYYPFTNSGVPARFEQGSLALFDMMARYEFNKTFSAQLNITNLFDRAYFGMASAQVQYGEPRNVTLSLSARF